MNTYLVRVNHFLVFLERDPRCTGCPYPVEPQIQLDDPEVADRWSERLPMDICVGMDPKDDHHFRLFWSPPRRARAGYHQIVGMPVIVPTWSDFLRVVAECGEVIERQW